MPLNNLHVRQREASDCVIATVAAIANIPYELAAESSPRKPGKKGLYPREVRKLLQNATQIKWKPPRLLFFRHLRSLCQSEYTLILFVRQPGNALLHSLLRKQQHCIFVKCGRVYDPEYSTAMSAENYPRIHWIPTFAFRPADLKQLQELQDINYARHNKERVWSEIFNA